MERERPYTIESPEGKKFGADVIVRNFWIRHAQKKSGEIASTEKNSISLSSISEQGAVTSEDYGRVINASEKGAKGYVSSSPRTAQTLEKVLDGYQKNNPDKTIRTVRIREELTSDLSPDFLALYNSKFGEQKQRVMVEMGFGESNFLKLSPDEQERIAEVAEEPVMREWLNDRESELARLYPPLMAARRFAHLFNQRHNRLAQKLYSGSEIDLFHITHKTITEPFLTSGVLIQKSSGERVTRLEQLGGSLQPLGDWQSEVATDEGGNPQIVIQIRGEDYEFDQAVFSNLLQS